MTPLNEREIAQALERLPGWQFREDALCCELRFGGFRDAMTFLMRASFIAEAANHHPEWSNVYDRVTIRLTTHDAGSRVTQQDLQLARALHALHSR